MLHICTVYHIYLLISLNCIIAISLSRCTIFFFSAPWCHLHFTIMPSQSPGSITASSLPPRASPFVPAICHRWNACLAGWLNCLLVDRLIGQYILAFTQFWMIYVISLRYLRNHSMSRILSWRFVWFWWATASTAKPLVCRTHPTPGRPHQIALWRGQQHQSLSAPGGQQGLQRWDDRSGWSTPYSWNGHPTLNDGNSL